MAANKQQPRIYITRELVLQLAILAVCLALPAFLVTDIKILPFAMIGAVMAGIIILKWPFIGLVFYLIIFYFRPQEIWFPGIVGLEKAFGIAMLILTLLKLKLKDNFQFKITNIHIGIIAFMVIALINVVFSFWITRSWDIWVQLFKLFIVFFCVAHLIDNEKQFRFFIILTILGTAFHASSAVINYYNGIRELEMGIERAFGMDTSYGDPNSLAATIVYTLPLIFYYFQKKSPAYIKISLAVISLISLWCVILTGSRTGMAGVLVFFMLVLWEGKHKLRNFLLIALSVMVIWSIMPAQYQHRFESIDNLNTQDDPTGAATSAESRFKFLGYAFDMLMDRPLFGYGLGNFPTARGMIYHSVWMQSHTLPAQIMSEMGLTGIIVFTLWMVFLFGSIKKLRRYFTVVDNKFMLNMTLAMKCHLLLMFFMGLGGHNLLRYNWFIISAVLVLLLNPKISGYGLPVHDQEILPDLKSDSAIIAETGPGR